MNMTSWDLRTPSGIIEAYRDGVIRESEALDRLDAMQVRGGFDGLAFTGYDYRNQVWIEVE